MRTRSIEILPDHFYHVYNRGNNKQPIFRTAENYQFFLRRLAFYFAEEDIRLVAYCLMPNHFHLLVFILRDFDFPNHMRSFSTSFVKSIHSWYHTSGHLFEDDYQVKPIAQDAHLIQVIPYMHLNPVKAGLVSKPEDWEFSDCATWCRKKAAFPSHALRDQLYGGSRGYREYLAEFGARSKEIQQIERRLLGRGKKSDIQQ